MMDRCYDPCNPKYSRYGARGILVCPRWHNFKNFFTDMGHPPKGMSIDRINNDGNYEPKNVRWASQLTQQNNRANNRWLTIRGKTKLVTEWAAISGISSKIIRQRIDRDGFSPEESIE